jgi:hypothetical protein
MIHKTDHFNFFQKSLFFLFRNFLSDKQFANLILRRWYGRGNVDYPITFNEKIQWLKLNNRNPAYSLLSDKLNVREFVKSKINRSLLNELYAVWENIEEVDFEYLPTSFVLKATHGSGMNIIVRDKAKLDKIKTITILKKWLNTDYSKIGREWNYKEIPRKVIAEKLLLDDNGKIPIDYKFFCFNGEVKFISVDTDRFINQRRTFFDINWKKQEFEILHPKFDGRIEKPQNLSKMIQYAEILSENIPFVRVDFYAIPEVIFGELTFYPGNGTEPILPFNWDNKLGGLIDIKSIAKIEN